MWETWVQALDWEDSLKKEMQPTPVFLPGELHGQRNLAGYSPRGHKESDSTKQQQCAGIHAQLCPTLYPHGL